MTSRQLFEYALIETNKVGAQSLLLEDYVYLINKSFYQYLDKRYNIYDINQQTSDDLRVLKATAILRPVLASSKYGDETGIDSLYGAVYEVELPNDYFHILNCVCQYNVAKNFKCYNKGNKVQFPAQRLTGDMWPTVIINAYNKPSYKKPYFYLHNVNVSETNPTNPYDGTWGTDVQNEEDSQISGGLPSTIKLTKGSASNVERLAKLRYGNVSPVRMEIRYGKDNSLFELEKVFIDYIKTPQYIRLTQEELDLVEDTSQVLEWPDYVCYEIVKELVTLLLENAGDPRLQTNIPINQAIASPVQQQPQTK